MGKEIDDDGECYSYDQIIDWVVVYGLVISKVGLSCYKFDYLMLDVLGVIEVQCQVEVIVQVMGQIFGMEMVFLNMLINKVMWKLGEQEFVDDGKWLGIVVRGIEVLFKVKKQEVVFSKEKFEEVKGKFRINGVFEDIICMMDELLGVKW